MPCTTIIASASSAIIASAASYEAAIASALCTDAARVRSCSASWSAPRNVCDLHRGDHGRSSTAPFNSTRRLTIASSSGVSVTSGSSATSTCATGPIYAEVEHDACHHACGSISFVLRTEVVRVTWEEAAQGCGAAWLAADGTIVPLSVWLAAAGTIVPTARPPSSDDSLSSLLPCKRMFNKPCGSGNGAQAVAAYEVDGTYRTVDTLLLEFP